MGKKDIKIGRQISGHKGEKLAAPGTAGDIRLVNFKGRLIIKNHKEVE
jgi:hypothetical protein